jgi:CBS domain-containing protein
MRVHARTLVEEEVTVTTAKDIMRTEVVTVGSEESLSSAYRLFADEEISGAPVVGELGTIVGVVSARDLMRATREEQESSFVDSNYFRDGFFDSGGDCLMGGDDFEETLSQRTVSEVMTAGVVAAAPNTSVSEIVKMILRDRIHRVLVVGRRRDKDALVGLISLLDLVAAFASDECDG